MAPDPANESPSKAPETAPVFAGRAAILNFVAHPDDDLLFMSPDLLHAIQAGGNVRTVYLTAGDSGQQATSYWQDRENGVRAAYAEMASVANSWTQSDLGLAGHPIPIFTLTDQPNISVAFMRLPDGAVNGSGFASNGHQSLQKVWAGAAATIEAIDRSSIYTLSALTSTLAYFITSFQPEQVNTLDYRRTYGDGDHSDHHTVGYLAQTAMAQGNSSVALIGYEGYPVIPLPANVSDADQKAKQSVFFTYAQHDKLVLDFLAERTSSPYDSWLARQYRVNQPRSLITRCRGLTWRGVHRARLLAWAIYAKLRPLLVHLPLFEMLRNMAIRRIGLYRTSSKTYGPTHSALSSLRFAGSPHSPRPLAEQATTEFRPPPGM